MRIKATIKYLLLHMVYFFIGFIPRNRKIWIFGSRNETFFGNSKWLFLYLHNSHKTNIRKIWISRTKRIVKILKTKGFEAYYLKSLKGIYYAIRGGIYIFNVNTNYDINYFLSSGAKKINLWHGMGGIKKVGLDTDFNDHFYRLYYSNIWKRLKNRFFFPWEYEKYDIMAGISEKTIKFMKSAFGKRIKKIVATGYPRNDVLLKDIDSPFDKELIEKFKSNQKKIILYMPTHRDTKILNSEPMEVPIDWKKLDSFLEKNNSIFIMKLHPIREATLQFPAACKNIQTLDSLVDIYPVLKYIDILVTDYSTICYDIMLCNKPVIYFWYDFEEYITKNRTLYQNFIETAEPIAKTFDELLNLLKNPPKPKNPKLIHKHIDSNSSQRIYEEIISKFT